MNIVILLLIRHANTVIINCNSSVSVDSPLSIHNENMQLFLTNLLWVSKQLKK